MKRQPFTSPQQMFEYTVVTLFMCLAVGSAAWAVRMIGELLVYIAGAV